MQQIIAPDLEGMMPSQRREFGLLEMIQNGLLLAIVILLAIQVWQRKQLLEKLIFAIGLGALGFLFLEEIDYGLHFYEFLTGNEAGVEKRNWHNQWDGDLENATRLKRLNDALFLLWFVLVPLLVMIKPLGRIAARIPVIPSRWFLAGFIIALLCSSLAHALDDAGFGVINGQDGNLAKTIAEFRETSIYYLYLLYVLQLARSRPLLWRPAAEDRHSD